MTELLLGAVYADDERTDAEIEAVRKLLADVFDGDLPAEVAARIDDFDAAAFSLGDAVVPFAEDPPELKRKLLELIAAVRDADDVHDLEEDAYIGRVALALDVDKSAYADLVLDLEIEDLSDVADTVRKGPPKPPA